MSRKISFAVAFACVVYAQSDLGNTMRAFEDKPGYVQPVATVLGTVLNAGWVNSARVGRGSGWNFALSIPLAYIGTADHTYDFRRSTGCAELRASVDPVWRPNGYNCPVQNDWWVVNDVPTIWGNDAVAYYYEYRPTGDGPTDYQQVRAGSLDRGNPDLREWTTLGFVLPSFSFSKAHFRGTARLMGIPAVKEFGGLLIWGLGFQYDFTRWLPPAVAQNDISLSATANVSSWDLSYKPNRDVRGELSLGGLTTVSGLALGWRWQSLELFTELGYETATMKSSGSLMDYGVADNPSTAEDERLIQPRVSVDGRNGWRASFNLALHLGVWQPVVAQSVGAQRGTLVNLIQFGKEGEP